MERLHLLAGARLFTAAVMFVGALTPAIPAIASQPVSDTPLVLAPSAPDTTPVTITKQASLSTGFISNTLIYTISVSNPTAVPWFYQGPADSLPPQVSLLSATPGYTYTAPLIRWNIPPTVKMLPPFFTDVYTIAVHIDQCGTLLSNIASIRVSPTDAMQQGEVVSSNKANTEVPCIQPQPVFEVSKYVNTGAAHISDTIRYMIRVTNTGTATGIFYGPLDMLPTANATFLGATPGYLGPNPIKWNPGGLPLPPGGTAVYTIAMHVDGPCGATFDNRAAIDTSAGLVPSNAVTTTVLCDGGWKWSPPYVTPGGPITFVVHVENPTGALVSAGWTDPAMKAFPLPHVLEQPDRFVITPTDGSSPPDWNPVPFQTGILSEGALIEGLPGVQMDNCAAVLTRTVQGGTQWSGLLQPGQELTCGFVAAITTYAKCGDWINNTVVYTHVIPGTNIVTTTYGTSSSRVMCPDLGDAPDSGNHAGWPMLVHPFGMPSPIASYPSVYSPKPPVATGPIHWLAGGSSAPGGPPGPAIDSALGLMAVPQTTTLTSIVSNERDADLLPDQDPLALKRNIRPNPNPALGRSNRDGYDNAFTGPSGAPLLFALPQCANSVVQYALYIKPASIYPGPRFINLWIDWNRDGDWADAFLSPCPNLPAPVAMSEWVVQNALAPAASGIYMLPPVPLGNVPLTTPMWVRISVADAPAPAGSVGNGPPAGYLYGETEDHYMCFKPNSANFGGSWGDCAAAIIIHADPNGVITVTKRLSVTTTALAGPPGSTLPFTFSWQISDPNGVNLKLAPLAALAAAPQHADDSGVIDVVNGQSSSVEMGGVTPGQYDLALHVTNGDGEEVDDTYTVVVDALRTVFLPATRRDAPAGW